MLIEVPEKVAKKIVVKRDGKKVDFDGSKIALAIKKGFDSVNQEEEIPKYSEQDINKVYNLVIEEIQKNAIKAFKSIDGRGLARVDFFIEEGTNNIYINEINTMPGFTKISMYPKLFDAVGIKYSELLDKLIENALENKISITLLKFLLSLT